jgi:hypothetical protein
LAATVKPRRGEIRAVLARTAPDIKGQAPEWAPPSPSFPESPVSRSPLLALALVLVAPAAFAQGTPEQRAACTPDVLRLCSADIPDVGRITVCLKRERARVGSACRQALGGLDVTTTGSLAKRQDRRVD